MDRFGWNLGSRIPLCPWLGRNDAVAQQPRIEHLAAMDVWRQNALSNFDEIGYRAANLKVNDSPVTKYDFF